MRRLALLLLLAGGCSNLPPERPPPPVRAAPAALARLRIHVWHASDARAREEKEDDVTGYTLQVRGAVQKALTRAGYVVVVDPAASRDLEARIHTDYQSRSRGVGGTLVTSLVLMAPGGVLEQLSGALEVDEHASLDETGAARLVESIAASARVARYAESLKRPDIPCAPRAPEIAGDGR